MENAPSAERRDIWSEAISKAQAIKVRNVMNPLLWLNAVTIPLFLVAGYMLKSQLLLAVPLLFIAFIVPIFTMMEYRYFSRKDPGRLHSEEYLIEQQRLMIQSKNSQNSVDAASLPAGGNPELGMFIEDRLVIQSRQSNQESAQESGDE